MAPRPILTVNPSPRKREGGGFVVRRPVGNQSVDHVGPFLMLDHFGPVTYGPGEAVGAPTHPHRGQMTVSYLLSGSLTHRDSMGTTGTLGPGWLQCMVAGRGVLHSEMPGEDLLRDGGESEGFQLWVNLAPEHKMIAPSYQDVPPERVPVHTRGAAEVRVLVGRSVLSAAGEAAAATTLSPVTLLDVAWAGAPAGAVHAERVEPGHEGFVYVYRGSVTVNGRTLVEGDCALLGPAASDDETEVIFSGTDGGRALLAAGLPVPGPIVRHGPFVMNTREQIEQCFADLEDGSFGKIEGTEDEARATAAAVAKQRETGTWDAQMRGDGPKK